MAKERIGIMGGTFNPIHLGHIHMAKAAAASGQLDQVLVMPTGHPPHKQSPAPAVDRWRMVCAAVAQEPLLTPSSLEMDRPGVIYTIDTLSILREKYPKADLCYIIGADTLMELRNWRQYEQVLKMCSFLVCPRAWDYTARELGEERKRLTALGGSFTTIDMEPMEASSTEIRAALARGDATPMLPAPCREYASLRGLYGMTPRLDASCDWLDRLFDELSLKRFSHTLGVAYTARRLALIHGVDPDKAEIAGLLHDCAKCMPLSSMQKLCRDHALTTDETVLSSGALLHAVAGAYLARETYGVNDPDILAAIACHTTGKVNMTPLDMVVYLADKIEPTRESYPLLEQVRMLAQLSLEKALLASMEGTTQFVRKGGKTLHPLTLQAIGWLHTLAQ